MDHSDPIRGTMHAKPPNHPTGAPSNSPAADPRPDQTLARAAGRGDREAFACLYDRHAGLIRAVAYDQCRDRAAANEIAQEAFLKAWGGITALRDPDRFLPWLLQITRNCAKDDLRQTIRRRQTFGPMKPDATLPAPDTRPPPDPLEHEDLLAAVADLPEPERTAVRLFYLAQEPAERARGVLGLSKAGFYRALNRARHKVRERLDPNRSTPAPGNTPTNTPANTPGTRPTPGAQP